MKSFLFSRTLPFAFLFALICSFHIAAQTSEGSGPLTNAAVVKLVKAGFKEKTIISIIASRPAHFDLSTDRMIELKRTGVSEKVILAMMARQEGSDFGDDSWADDEFFSTRSDSLEKSMPKSGSGNGSGNPSDGSSVDIFGSSGGVRGSTRSRGGNGSASGDTITTGSATVRILRPPTEAGGAAPKLEKNPSLTNDTIIELVEAGFSEGTIVRRIEQSPVAFDLAPEKLSDLRKHRVTEKIVVAMKTAMGADADPSTPPTNVTPKQ
jgi:hypothetical protein